MLTLVILTLCPAPRPHHSCPPPSTLVQEVPGSEEASGTAQQLEGEASSGSQTWPREKHLPVHCGPAGSGGGRSKDSGHHQKARRVTEGARWEQTGPADAHSHQAPSAPTSCPGRNKLVCVREPIPALIIRGVLLSTTFTKMGF